MNWKEEISKIEKDFGLHKKKEWKADIVLINELLRKSPNDVDLNIRVIYILHNILVEEDYTDEENNLIANLLVELFNKSSQFFSDNPKYLFFIGKILYIAEWYFGLDDDFKATEEKTAYKMEKKAFELEPENLLYKWGYLFSLGEKKEAFLLSKEILFGKDDSYIECLKKNGFCGKYIIQSLQYCFQNYTEVKNS